MTKAPDTPERGGRARYGYDAPGFIRGFLGVGAAGQVLGWGLARVARGSWLGWVGAAIGIAAVVPLSLGGVMLTYSAVGKTRVRELMLDPTPWTGDERVLDIGTGAGLLAIGAAKRLTTGRVIGLDLWSAKDLTDNTRASTQRNLAIEGVTDRVEIVDGDARSLPFADGAFDRVLSLLCLHNIEEEAERRGACAEIARVLAPGGVAVIGDYVPVGAYAEAFEAAGLRVTARRSAFATALGPAWLVVAEKPAAGAGA